MKKLTVNEWAKTFGGIGSAKAPGVFIHKSIAVGPTEACGVMIEAGTQCGRRFVSATRYLADIVADIEIKNRAIRVLEENVIGEGIKNIKFADPGIAPDAFDVFFNDPTCFQKRLFTESAKRIGLRASEIEADGRLAQRERERRYNDADHEGDKVNALFAIFVNEKDAKDFCKQHIEPVFDKPEGGGDTDE